jgi:hypothetical protein
LALIGREGLMGMIGVDKIGEIRRAYFEQGRPIKEIVRTLSVSRVAVRASMNLNAVHRVIQVAMGWLNSHLWEFAADGRKYSVLVPNDRDWNERIRNAAKTKLSTVLSTGVREIGYVYDMGDNWQHRIIVENLKAAEPGVLYPEFLGGERRCPPEDCGGTPGYYEFLKNIASKQDKKRNAALEWYGHHITRVRLTRRRSSLPSSALQIRVDDSGGVHVTDFGRFVVGAGSCFRREEIVRRKSSPQARPARALHSRVPIPSRCNAWRLR